MSKRVLVLCPYPHGVAAGQRGKQGHLQQFIIAQRLSPRTVEPLAQPLAMAEIIRRLDGQILGLAGFGGHRR